MHGSSLSNVVTHDLAEVSSRLLNMAVSHENLGNECPFPDDDEPAPRDVPGLLRRVFRQRESKLSLRETRLESLPARELTGFDFVREVDLTNCKLTNLDGIENFRSLRVLVAVSNELTTLPASIGQLTGLERLNLGMNGRLVSLPDEFCGLVSLKSLTVYHTPLAALPQNFGRLTALENLFLSSNQLASLPESVSELVSLTGLFLQHNALRKVPDLSKLTNLTQLHLQDNHVRCLPSGLRNLHMLNELYVQNNELHFLPKGVDSLCCLAQLWTSANPLEFPTPAGLLKSEDEIARSRRKRKRWAEVGFMSLMEWAGQHVVDHRITYDESQLPQRLVDYLAAHRFCDLCERSYFESFEGIFFVDVLHIATLSPPAVVPCIKEACSAACIARRRPHGVRILDDAEAFYELGLTDIAPGQSPAHAVPAANVHNAANGAEV